MQTAETLTEPIVRAKPKLTVVDPAPPSSLRICLLGYRSHPFCGGQGVYIKYLSKALVDAGHRVDVISGAPYPHLDPRVRLVKMPSLNLYEVKNRFTALRLQDLKSYTNLFEWFSTLSGGFPEPYTFGRRVAKYLAKHGKEYDLVHDNQSLCFGLLDLQKMGLPTIATIHHPITRDLKLALDAESDWGLRLLIRRWHSFLGMQKKVAQKLKHVVTVSEISRTDIADAFGLNKQRINLIYNGIDTQEFSPLPGIERKPFRLMTTASADQPLKGLRYLLEAMSVLKHSYPELSLLVVGKLKADGVTEKLIKKLGLESSIIFVFGIETREIVEYYAEASLAVVPSLYEGFGLPAGEAMACGVPVIATDGGALPEVVGDAGIQVPAGDSQALVEAITELFEDEKKRQHFGQLGRKRILEKFCWNVAAKQMTSYYHQVLNYANH